MKEPETINSVLRRLASLESHLLNLVIPITQLHSILTDQKQLKLLSELLKNPLKIDTSRIEQNARILQELIKEFKDTGLNLEKSMEKINLSQTYGEIKYIGMRLKCIKNDIEQIKKQSLKQKIRLNLLIEDEDSYMMRKDEEDFNEKQALKLIEKLKEKSKKIDKRKR